MWTEKKPEETGYYWFYGDPFWDQLPRDNGKNPFNPEMVIVEVTFIREGFCTFVYSGAFCYKMKGLWWNEKIVSPQPPSA